MLYPARYRRSVRRLPLQKKKAVFLEVREPSCPIISACCGRNWSGRETGN